MGWVTLEGCEVIGSGDKAVLISHPGGTVWLPFSQMQDGEALTKGDIDIVVKQWIADKEGLPYD